MHVLYTLGENAFCGIGPLSHLLAFLPTPETFQRLCSLKENRIDSDTADKLQSDHPKIKFEF